MGGYNFKFYSTRSCPKCPMIKSFFNEHKLKVEEIDASTSESRNKAIADNVSSVPTIIVYKDGKEVARAHCTDELKKYI